MESYAIFDVERLTGIKAHTLRIWEKRYQSLVPHRTATNIRYYDDEQLRRLINISTLLEHGHKPSVLLALTDEQLHALILKVQAQKESNTLENTYINGLINAMLAFDELNFDKHFSTVITRYGLYEAVIRIIYPFLQKTGVLWSTKGALPVQEHFATNIIKRKLMAAIDGVAMPAKTKKKFLLFLPPEEWHEIGLLFADYVIRSAGHQSLYLGQSVPFANLEHTIKKTKPDALLAFFVSVKGKTAKRKLAELATDNPQLNIFLCTSKINLEFDNNKNIIQLSQPAHLTPYL